MKIKCTLTFAKTMQKEFNKNEKTKNYKIDLVKLTDDLYGFFVDYNRKSIDFDYNYNIGKWQVLKIIYPYDYYAMPKYLTTVDLLEIFRKSDKTFDGFMQKIADCVEA